ncbi:MAG: hypothetical protein IPN32_08105 [Deltaproteobacteria bacterium]|nr:hypothetical protein [Deltaproteobacteria bacterium]
MKKPRILDIAPTRRRAFMKLCAGVLAAPAVPAAVRFALNEELFGEAHAFTAEQSLPTYFIEMNLRDQWDFGHVFVPPSIAQNAANLMRGGSGDALSLFFTADQITAHDRNFYLTPDSQVLVPHLDNIAVVETNALCEGAIHGHESANPMRSPGRTKTQAAGKQPMWMGEPGYEEQGNDFWYSSTPTPATLHNYWQKQLTPDVANGITMKFISRFHTISHFAAGLTNAELTRIQSVQMLFDTFPTSVEDLAIATPEEAAVFAAALKRADGGFFKRHGFDATARMHHEAHLAAAEGKWYHVPKVVDLPFTPDEIAYWQTGVPDQVGDNKKANIWEQAGWAFKLLSNDVTRTVSLEFDYLDVHDSREESVMKTMAAQSALPLARLIESIKAIPGMWERTVIAVYSADGCRSPSANSYGNEGKSSFVLAGGRINGGYFGDVRVASNTGSGHTWSYFSPDESGAPVVPVSGPDGRLSGARSWRTVMRALDIPDDIADSYPDVAGQQPMSFMLA